MFVDAGVRQIRVPAFFTSDKWLFHCTTTQASPHGTHYPASFQTGEATEVEPTECNTI
jgi:hypothetical protein